MEKNERINELELKSKSPTFQIVIIGIIFAGSSIFGFYEMSLFNTYIEHILNLGYIYISIMVIVSGIMGLIFLIVFGILSDNTRTKYGRRRPYLLFGILAGIAMYLYAFSPNFLWCFILDAIIIGVISNAFYAGSYVLIPDIVVMERRGRANGIVQIFSLVGSMLPTALVLYVNEFYSTQSAKGTIITQEGYILSFAFGALAIIIVAILGFLLIREKPVAELPPRKKFLVDLKDTFQYKELKKHKHFFRIIVALTVFNIGIRIILPFIWNYFFSLSLTTLGLILLFGISLPVSIIIMYVLGKIVDKHGRKKFLTPTILISSIGFFIIPFFSPDTIINFIIYVIAFTLILIALMGLYVPLNTWRQDLLPEHERGKYTGIQNIMDTISQIPGAIIGGLVADAFGIQWIFVVVPIFLIGSIPFFMTVRETLSKNVIEELS